MSSKHPTRKKETGLSSFTVSIAFDYFSIFWKPYLWWSSVNLGMFFMFHWSVHSHIFISNYFHCKCIWNKTGLISTPVENTYGASATNEPNLNTNSWSFNFWMFMMVLFPFFSKFSVIWWDLTKSTSQNALMIKYV